MLDLIDQGASEGGAAGRHWVLDPIDGTRGFVGLRQYAICLGMLQDGKVSGLAKPWPALAPCAEEAHGQGRRSMLGCTFAT